MKKANLIKVIKKFKNTNILVIGDVMLDKFIWGNVSRISPEAPVPVVHITKESFMPGGAGNVVSNIKALGGNPFIIGGIGHDLYGDEFLREMNERGIDSKGLVSFDDRSTIVKTRIIAHNQQVVRVDREHKRTMLPKYIDKVNNNVKDIIKNVSAVIISDYGKGIINKKTLAVIIKEANKYKVPILVDPKIEHFKNYKKVTCITPNIFEAIAGMNVRNVDTQNDDDISELGFKIMSGLKINSLLITRGEKGVSVFEKHGHVTHIPTMAQEVYDVTGAGDTVISVMAMCLANNSTILDASYISNFAAGIVVGKLGTATIAPEEIEESIMKNNGVKVKKTKV